MQKKNHHEVECDENERTGGASEEVGREKRE